ncbi:MAG: sugar ABC transporter substrate-binding protein, partial [Euzebyales bacterium]|nr:sugar ABC transporter substrate-binding protein [Euzebyales bacterium]
TRGVAFLLVLVLSAVACADRRGDGPRGTGPQGKDGRAAGTVELVAFGDPVETAGYEEMITEFEAANPDVDVAFGPVPDQDQLLARLTTAFAGGDPPDAFLINYRKYGQFADQGVLEPVQSWLDSSDVIAEGDFAGAALDAFRFDGAELTCLPQNVSSLEVYYNADLFERAGLERPRAGWSWDDFLAAAKVLTGDGTYGVGTEASIIRVAPFVWSAGGEIADDEQRPTTLTLDRGRAREALDFFLDLQTVHGVAPPEREELSQGSQERFLAGTLGMYLDSRKAVPGLRTIEGFTWDVAPLPVAPGGEPATILHGDAYCMTAASSNKEATWRLIEFANSREGQLILAESGRTVPSRTDVAQSDAFLGPEQPPASSEVFVDAIPTIRSVPHTANWSRVEKEADNVLESLYYGRVEREAGVRQLVTSTRPLFGAGGS